MVNEKKDLIKKIIARAVIVLALLLMYAPIIYVVVYSFTEADTLGEWSGFSFENFRGLLSFNNKKGTEIREAIGNTIKIALVASLISTVIGTLGAIGIYNIRKKHLKKSMDFITQIPIVDAEIVTGVALFVLFLALKNTFQIPRSFASLVIGHVVITIPYVVISVTPKLEQMDPSLYEAALDLGATRTQALFKVIIPEIVPGIITGFMLSITLSLDDFVITEFTKPEKGGFETVSTFVENSLRKGLPPQIRAFITILFVIIIFVIVGMIAKSSIDKKKQKSSSNKGEIL